MLSADVSPRQGHDALVPPNVIPASAPSHLPLFSQFKGPFVYNETDEERQKREEEEKKRTNFDKVREKAEREEAARKEAEAERDALRKEKADREAADRKAQEERLAQDKKWEELAAQREAEAKAEAEKARLANEKLTTAEKRLKEIEDAQEAELAELLKTFPEGKQPPLDAADPVAKRLQHAKYAKSLIATDPDDPVGVGAQGEKGKMQDRLKELIKKPRRTEAESAEMARLDQELKSKS